MPVLFLALISRSISRCPACPISRCPVNLTDPSGQFVSVAAGCLGGAGIELGFELMTNGRKRGCVNWYNVASGALGGCVGVGLANRFSKLQRYVRCTNSFPGDTLVHTKDGLKPIDQIQVNDQVLSFSEQSETTGYEPVTRVIRGEGKQTIKVLTFEDGETVRTTEGHPFYVIGEGWRPAKTFKVGTQLQTHDGKTVVVREIATEQRHATVYNLSVAGTNNFHVGIDGVLVHNANCNVTKGAGKGITNPNVAKLARPSRPAGMTQSQFGKDVIGWGSRPQGALDRIGGINSSSVAKMREQGLTRGMAKEWRDFYSSEFSRNANNLTAANRVKLMDKILDNF